MDGMVDSRSALRSVWEAEVASCPPRCPRYVMRILTVFPLMAAMALGQLSE